MNLMDSFNNFYNNLSFNGLFFFWIVVFLFVLLTILLIVLAVKNNKLSKLLKERQDNIINQNTDDLENVEKEEISVVVENKQEENTVQEEVKKAIQEDTKKDNIIKEEGPDHNKTFTAEVECNGRKLATGVGRSKKSAEMEAARKAIKII